MLAQELLQFRSGQRQLENDRMFHYVFLRHVAFTYEIQSGKTLIRVAEQLLKLRAQQISLDQVAFCRIFSQELQSVSRPKSLLQMLLDAT